MSQNEVILIEQTVRPFSILGQKVHDIGNEVPEHSLDIGSGVVAIDNEHRFLHVHPDLLVYVYVQKSAFGAHPVNQQIESRFLVKLHLLVHLFNQLLQPRCLQLFILCLSAVVADVLDAQFASFVLLIQSEVFIIRLPFFLLFFVDLE